MCRTIYMYEKVIDMSLSSKPFCKTLYKVVGVYRHELNRNCDILWCIKRTGLFLCDSHVILKVLTSKKIIIFFKAQNTICLHCLIYVNGSYQVKMYVNFNVISCQFKRRIVSLTEAFHEIFIFCKLT